MNWTLKDLIAALEEYPADHPSPVSLEPCSHRWSYEQLAFVVKQEPCTVADLSETVEGADGATYDAWKGGQYTMGRDTEVFAVEGRGECGGTISAVLLRAWLGPVPVVLPEYCHEQDGQRFWRLGAVLLTPEGRGLRLEVTHGERTVIPAETLAWLRTGEVSP